MTQPEGKTLTLTRGARNTYVLHGGAQPAILELSSWRSRAQASVAGQSYELTMSGFLDRAACARRPGQEQPIIRIGRKSCVLPAAGACEWRMRGRWRGYEATLRVEELGEIDVYVSRRNRSDVVAQVHGNWPARDLIVLTAAFALLVRRRDDASASAAGAATIAGASTS